MEIKWFLSESEYEKYRKNQKNYSDSDGYGEYIGSVRTGDLCFDIINWGNHLWFDLYIGGIDTGYGYSDKEGFKGYPYYFEDFLSFSCYKNVRNIKYDKFVEILTKELEKHIKNYSNYEIDKGITLLDKANSELKLW